MGEGSFDQQRQSVGHQFNADHQEFAGDLVSNQYTAEGGQVTVNYQTDRSVRLGQRMAVDLYMKLGEAVDQCIEFRKAAEPSDDDEVTKKARARAVQQVIDDQTRPLLAELRTEMRRFRAVSKSQASAELAEKIILTIFSIGLGAANVALARLAGRAPDHRGAGHLDKWPTSTAMIAELERLDRKFLEQIVRS
ncbi:hypothetical protein QIS99_20535 [Streptomyces sp. B-S-A8]|uniref:Uncharacterized protein n=1 Tax=Streptomyces solicavernae TaxID=3043614 RepID=A0ABT6RVX9_9ACTN|nr:hypothetical protein [Streptomyces sp. B-S-A8]MDI3388574.1 hypothetical protein [Streptomyces sp. B-S-A8]